MTRYVTWLIPAASERVLQGCPDETTYDVSNGA